jgi:hypothetical protein
MGAKGLIGDMLQGMGPGLLSGLGKHLADGDKAHHFEQDHKTGPGAGSDGKVPSYKHGTDRVPKTGIAILHKDEAVLPKEEADKHREKKHNVSLYRAMHHLNKGGLHRALGIKEGEPIPEDRLEAAKHSSNPHVAHMANFAATMKGFKH